MNSWKSVEFSAWRPPLMMLSIGTGRVIFAPGPRCLYRGTFLLFAAARATAIERPSMALAPILDLSGVPSTSKISLSMDAWSRADLPMIAGARCFVTFSTAFSTPLPPKRSGSPSRSSSASKAPVLAPDGTRALPLALSESSTSTSTVGLPLESRTSLAMTLDILLTRYPSNGAASC